MTKDPLPIPPGASQRAQALRRLADFGIPVDGSCGLYKLTADELTRLADAIQAWVNSEGIRGFDAAQGR
jgi:hypothetical protein